MENKKEKSGKIKKSNKLFFLSGALLLVAVGGFALMLIFGNAYDEVVQPKLQEIVIPEITSSPKAAEIKQKKDRVEKEIETRKEEIEVKTKEIQEKQESISETFDEVNQIMSDTWSQLE